MCVTKTTLQKAYMDPVKIRLNYQTQIDKIQILFKQLLFKYFYEAII